MAKAVVAAAVLRPPFVLSTFTPYTFFSKSHILSFSTFSQSENLSVHSHALRPVSPPPEGKIIGNGDSDSFKMSRNERKREARRAVRWGMDLSTFSLPQIKSIIRAVSLEREVLDAILLVKRLGPDVREGRRRQFNYIGRLLRKAQPELMDALIQASKDGDTTRLEHLTGQVTSSVDDDEDEEEELEYELEEGESYMEVADKWLDGLIYKDPTITKEVYSIHSVDFDRQELRRLVRRVQSVQEEPQAESDQSVLEDDDKCNKSKKPLLRFLRLLAKKSLTETRLIGWAGGLYGINSFSLDTEDNRKVYLHWVIVSEELANYEFGAGVLVS